MNNGGLRYQVARLGIVEKLIAINVLVFVVNALMPFLLGLSTGALEQWFALPRDVMTFLSRPWSLVTYSFFHGGIGHIFWNMLLLYFSGRLMLNLFGSRKFINVYFLGVMFGGLLFMLSYNIFPAFMGVSSILIGASAGVTAVLIFVCAYSPNQEVRIIFFNVKLWQLGLAVVLIDLVQLPYGNAGGHLAHLGGAFLGYVYARQLVKGTDIGAGFSRFLDAMANLFKTKGRKAPLKTVYRGQKSKSAATINRAKDIHQKKIDTILDKISKSGYESLSKTEKDFLFKAGKEE
tara:strand:- start:2763 stop:3635 length:873 start_codon:yes stop_codon:yes gene_type:complete